MENAVSARSSKLQTPHALMMNCPALLNSKHRVSRTCLAITTRGTCLFNEALPLHNGIERERGIMVVSLSIKAYTDIHLCMSHIPEGYF
jgi:hypothetical protein